MTITFETLILAFIGFAALVCVLAFFAILNDIRHTGKAPVYPMPPQIVPPQYAQPQYVKPESKEEPEEEPKTEGSKEEVPAETEPAAIENAEGIVSFAGGNKPLSEKYRELTAASRKRYDAVVAYASKIEGVKHAKNDRFEEFKLVTTRIVRLQIKRGVVVCEFVFQNRDFKNYVDENKLSVKQAPIVMKLTDDASLQPVYDSIDLAVKAFAEDREAKKQLMREKRKAANRAKA